MVKKKVIDGSESRRGVSLLWARFEQRYQLDADTTFGFGLHSCCKYTESAESIGFILKTSLSLKSHENTMLLATEDLLASQQVMNEDMLVRYRDVEITLVCNISFLFPYPTRENKVNDCDATRITFVLAVSNEVAGTNVGRRMQTQKRVLN